MGAQKTLGYIIKRKRVEAGYSLSEVAALMPYQWYGMTVMRMEKEERKLSLEEAVYLAKVLGCTLEDLAAPFIEEAQGWEPDSDAIEKLTLKKKIAELERELQNLKEKK